MNRTLAIAAAAAVAGVAAATPAAAQRVWQDGRWVVLPQHSAPQVMPVAPQRWGQPLNGRWEAGYRAPGGWGAYRRLGRGAALPGYWMRSDFRVPDFHHYGLSAPPQGYFWVRYYDDAVLVDGRGQVWDSVGGIGWGGGAAAWSGGGYGGSYSSSESYAQVGTSYAPPRGPIQPIDPNAYYDAPPYAGVEPIPYPPQYPGGYAPPVAPPPVVQFPAPQPCVQACGGYQGGYQVQGSGSYGGYGGYSYGSYGAGTTTVIVTPAPVTTTVVTEEVIEEVTTTSYVRTAPRRVVRRAPVRYKPRPKPACCKCVCR